MVGRVLGKREEPIAPAHSLKEPHVPTLPAAAMTKVCGPESTLEAHSTVGEAKSLWIWWKGNRLLEGTDRTETQGGLSSDSKIVMVKPDSQLDSDLESTIRQATGSVYESISREV